MDSTTTSNGGFLHNLAYRPQKRKRDEVSPPLPDNDLAGEPESFAEMYSRLVNETEPKSTRSTSGRNNADRGTHPDAKKRRPNSPGDEIPVDDSRAVTMPEDLFTVESLSLVAQRVARRRRAAVDPFIPKKGVQKKAVVKRRPKKAPFFGQASLMSAEEVQLVLALGRKPQQVNMAMSPKDLPAPERDPENETMNDHEHMVEHAHFTQVEGPTTQGGEQTFVAGKTTFIDGIDGAEDVKEMEVEEENEDLHCVCRGESDDGLVLCTVCSKHFHPVCIGKGRQSNADYEVENVREKGIQNGVSKASEDFEAPSPDSRHQARLDDVKFWHDKGNFTCLSCDKKAAKKASVKLSPTALDAEKQRRNKIFAAKNGFKPGETELRECDNCQDPITSTRYECKYCANFDLCIECFMNPSITCKHQHAEVAKKSK